MARVDVVEDESFPALQKGRGAQRKHNAHSAVAEHNATIPGAPAQGYFGDAYACPCIGLSFAHVIMEAAMGQQDKAAGHARLARQVQNRNPSGKLKAGRSTAPTGFTDVVVIRDGSSDEKEVEEAFRCRHPVDITQAAQWALNTLVRSPPIILHGCWSEMVERTGNFVFRFAGDLSPATIASYQTSLCSHFPAAESACVVPTAGWTWVQLRGVDVACIEGDTQEASY
jgi:hypothetical protein